MFGRWKLLEKVAFLDVIWNIAKSTCFWMMPHFVQGYQEDRINLGREGGRSNMSWTHHNNGNVSFPSLWMCMLPFIYFALLCFCFLLAHGSIWEYHLWLVLPSHAGLLHLLGKIRWQWWAAGATLLPFFPCGVCG